MSSGFFKKIHKICQAKNTMKEKEKYEEIIVSACFSLVESRGIVRSELMQRMRSCREKDESTNNYQKMISYRKLFIYKLRSSSAVKVRYNFGLLKLLILVNLLWLSTLTAKTLSCYLTAYLVRVFFPSSLSPSHLINSYPKLTTSPKKMYFCFQCVNPTRCAFVAR